MSQSLAVSDEIPPVERIVLNPPVGISHVTRRIEDLYAPKSRGKDVLFFHPAAQLNSHPHLGTVTTLAATFALAKCLQHAFNIRPDIVFWSLENAPGEIVETKTGTYYRTLELTIVEGESKATRHKRSFTHLLKRLSHLSGLPHQVLTYGEFQAIPRVRELILQMIGAEERLAPLLCPSEQKFKVRFACPGCGFAHKSGGSPINIEPGGRAVTYRNRCFDHGDYERTLSVDNDELFDINTPVRALAREALFIERAKTCNGHNIMSDGADWAHYGTINLESLHLLGYSLKEMPMRFFAPVILDWSGAKLAKSAQVGSDAYKDLPQCYVNLATLLSEYGDRAIDAIWWEVSSWMENPKKIFRSYSIDYMARLFGSL